MDTFVIILIVILVIIYLGQKAFFNESFANTDNEPFKLYVFVSSHCPHCHTYLDNHHSNVCALAKYKGIDVEKVQSDGSAKSNDLFSKYDVQFIPTAIIVKGNKVHKNLGSNITPQTVKSALEN
jgi:hypothetical protein